MVGVLAIHVYPPIPQLGAIIPLRKKRSQQDELLNERQSKSGLFLLQDIQNKTF